MPDPSVDLPPLPLTGGCQCGAVRYRIEAEPVAFYLCHCTECQTHTSSAFGESLRVERRHVSIEGRLEKFERDSESGKRRQCWFCPACGTRIVHGELNTDGGNEVNIKAGTLDDTHWLVPAAHIWTSSAQPWFPIPGDALTYEHQPDADYAAIKTRWRSMLANR